MNLPLQQSPDIATFWVSPSGDDNGPGTRDAPFRTLAHTHSQLCRRAEAAPPESAITVILEDGTYPVSAPLVFDPGLFGPTGPKVRFTAADEAAPTISGGRRITGWTLHDAARNIYTAPAQGLRTRQLYINGQRATRAATSIPEGGIPAGFRPTPILPDPPPTRDDPYVIGGGIDFLPTDINPAGWRDPASWCRPAQVEAVIETQWKMMRLPVRSITAANGTTPGTIELAQPAWTNANLAFTSSSPQNGAPPVEAPGIWSFWQVTRFENDYSFLDQPGEWVLDTEADALFYIPRPGEDLSIAEVIAPAIELLIKAIGHEDRPVCGLSFEGIGFSHATWNAPSDDDGYVVDQSGFHLRGNRHRPNLTGHSRYVDRTPGNLRFAYAQGINFNRCRFEHLGAVALDFDTGSQGCRITRCSFDDIASAAIQVGGIAACDVSPTPAGHTRDTVITDNRIRRTGRDYVDTAAIYLGFTTRSTVTNNTISEVPWSGIALGWGWGLLDPGSYPGIPNAKSGMWGVHTGPTVNCGNQVSRNHISRFLETLWDGGAIYCCGWQGNSFDDALRIEGNVACDKRPGAGGNVLYTDGGSRYVIVRGNALFDNPIGHVYLGPPPHPGDPLSYNSLPSTLNGVPYGGDIGGCRTYGDIRYEDNYWATGLQPAEEVAIDVVEEIISTLFTGTSFDTYSPEGFFDICPYSANGTSFPTGLVFTGNHALPLGRLQVPQSILQNAGVRSDNDAAANYVATGTGPQGGGASFPPRYPGPSWSVPRVSLPGLFGMQPQYAQEWWYYVGVIETSLGELFSLHIQIGRFDVGLQLGLGLTGIGWRDERHGSCYLSGEGVGFGVSSSPWLPAAGVIPPVSDTAYSASLRPLLEVVGRSPDLARDLHLNLPWIGSSQGWQFEYDVSASDGAPVGLPGSRYTLSAQGQGLIATADTATTRRAGYAVTLDVTDFRGTVMEGLSAYVGPEMFADGGIGLSSYECAQPVLRIATGTLAIDGEEHLIAGGTLWLDRQMLAKSVANSTASDQGTDGTRRQPGKGWVAALRGNTPSSRPLYLGDWIAVTLDDGHSLALAEFWQPSTPQWITGTGVGKPPKHGFGNLYYPLDRRVPQGNGGLALTARTAQSGEDWDFDLNILTPADPAHSPHWRSPASGKTYATAWRIDFAPRAQRHGLPPALYLRTISENCEIIPATPDGGFFEGAALVYADSAFEHRLGHAFVEQMGFN
ncbi:hypothetical protein [Radicibacter daui]|uniref:hypothetical protein n=1 Tax=Radicibacter daui TaxID=3064829 RepID=UPI004046CA71